MEHYDIFISYRRTAYDTAYMIAEKLRCSKYSVFLDVDMLRAGRFDEQLVEVIQKCKDFIIVLPPKAFDRRMDDNDWIYREATWAMRTNKNIIPVMLDGFEWPFEMKEEKNGLLHHQAIIVNREEYFDTFIQRLQSRLISEPVIIEKRSLWKMFVQKLERKGIGPENKPSIEPDKIEKTNPQQRYEQPIRKDKTKEFQYCNSSNNERKYEINTSTLTIRFGNIIDSDADVIVSSDDSELSMGGGISGTILVNGGEVILEDARKNIPAQLGDVIITTAGKLSQKYIFHCVTIDYSEGARNSSEDTGLQDFIIRRSVDKCLRMMPLLGIGSIAFPAIGAGVAHFSIEELATSMVEIITDFLYTTSKKYQIEIYLFDRFHQKEVLDYMAFFESVAKSIENHKTPKTDSSEIYMPNPIMIQKSSKSKSFGIMAALSPHDDHKVFVSYSRTDMETAQLFCEQMDNMGISYWIDINGKYSGNNFKEVLVDAIDSCQVMLFLSSLESNNSPFVIKEISLAVAGNKTILPIRLDDAQYAKSIRFDLSDIDWIEFSKGNSDEAMEKFRYCLQLYLQ